MIFLILLEIIKKNDNKLYEYKFLSKQVPNRKKEYNLKFLFIIVLLYLSININVNIFFDNKIIVYQKDINKIKEYQLKDVLCSINSIIENKSILIFEPNPFHYECTPGYAKYFIDLGFNVDVLMNKIGKDSFHLFKDIEKIRIFIYDNEKQINYFAKFLIKFMDNYSLILVQTCYLYNIHILDNLGLLRNNKAIYVLHNTRYYTSLNFNNITNQNRIWTLGHFSIGLQVNPHYFGNIKLRDKNKKTRFFIVSTNNRHYNYIISAAEKIKNENLEFEFCVTGYVEKFSIDDLNEKIKDNFLFNYNVNFSILYELVESSDYIIINLDPDIDKSFINKKVTGAIQLSYGFFKPVLINKYFKDAYNMTKENSFIFEKGNFYNVMKNAILLNNDNYKIMQRKLINLTNMIYYISISNVKKTLNSLFIKL